MRLKQFIIQESRSQEISCDEAFEIIKSDCRSALRAYQDGYRLYRGVRGRDECVITDPKKGDPRVSAYASFNYYTMLLDNLPSWKKYPKRSRSVIGTTSYTKAKGYSFDFPYVMFPYDGSKIGVCPVDDIWLSFKIFNKYPDLFTTANELNIWINTLFGELFDEYSTNKNWNVFKKAMSEFDKKYANNINELEIDMNNNDIFNSNTYGMFSIKSNTGFFKDNYKNSMIKMFDKLLGPRYNGFKLTKDIKRIPQDREIWTDGKCVMMKSDIIDDYIYSEYDVDDTIAPNEILQNFPIRDILIPDEAIRGAYMDNLEDYIDNNKKLPTRFPAKRIIGDTDIMGTDLYEPYLAIIRSLFLGKKTVTVDIEGYTESDYVYDPWKIQPNKKFLGLEDFSDKDGLEWELEELKEKRLL